MAGDWIIMRMDLHTDPAVLQIAEGTGLSTDEVVGKLHRFWSWADTHTTNGRANGVTARQLDALLFAETFTEHLKKVGWLEVDVRGVSVPRFDRYCSKSAKRRGLAARRAARLRHAGVRKQRTKSAPTTDPIRSDPIRSDHNRSDPASDVIYNPMSLPAPVTAPGFKSQPDAGPGRKGSPHHATATLDAQGTTPLPSADAKGGGPAAVEPKSHIRGSLPVERFVQIFLIRHAEAFGFSGDSFERQRKALSAIAARMFDHPDREERMAESVSLVWEKRKAGMRFPVKAWQAEMNRRYPKR